MEVLRMMLDGDHPALVVLRRQLASCTVKGRDLTGVGFFVELGVPEEVPRIQTAAETVRIEDVRATVNDLKNGAGFMLTLEKGSLAELEGFSFGEPWPSVIETFQLSYEHPTRNLRCLGPN